MKILSYHSMIFSHFITLPRLKCCWALIASLLVSLVIANIVTHYCMEKHYSYSILLGFASGFGFTAAAWLSYGLYIRKSSL